VRRAWSAVTLIGTMMVIRCLVVPAVLRLLGRRAWWAPRWLQRAMPTVRVE
jgi:RND superfamily putative drug exporter